MLLQSAVLKRLAHYIERDRPPFSTVNALTIAGPSRVHIATCISSNAGQYRRKRAGIVGELFFGRISKLEENLQVCIMIRRLPVTICGILQREKCLLIVSSF